MASDNDPRWLDIDGDRRLRRASSHAEISPETVTLRAQSMGHQFRQQTHTLLSCLQHLTLFPASLIEQWRDQVTALDIKRPRASLRLLAALSETYDEASRRCRTDTPDSSGSMQVNGNTSRIGHEIDQLIRILERALAYETRQREAMR